MDTIHLSDALELMKRAEEFIVDTDDPACKQLVAQRICSLKRAVYMEHCIDVDSLPEGIPFCCLSKILASSSTLAGYEELHVAIGIG